jgi:hypothetical protein
MQPEDYHWIEEAANKLSALWADSQSNSSAIQDAAAAFWKACMSMTVADQPPLASSAKELRHVLLAVTQLMETMSGMTPQPLQASNLNDSSPRWFELGSVDHGRHGDGQNCSSAASTAAHALSLLLPKALAGLLSFKHDHAACMARAPAPATFQAHGDKLLVEILSSGPTTAEGKPSDDSLELLGTVARQAALRAVLLGLTWTPLSVHSSGESIDHWLRPADGNCARVWVSGEQSGIFEASNDEERSIIPAPQTFRRGWELLAAVGCCIPNRPAETKAAITYDSIASALEWAIDHGGLLVELYGVLADCPNATAERQDAPQRQQASCSSAQLDVILAIQ